MTAIRSQFEDGEFFHFLYIKFVSMINCTNYKFKILERERCEAQNFNAYICHLPAITSTATFLHMGGACRSGFFVTRFLHLALNVKFKVELPASISDNTGVKMLWS